MNTLLSRRIGGFILAASLLSLGSCQQDPQSANGPGASLPLSSGGNTAHPALTWSGLLANSHDNDIIYSNIMLADTDGTHQTSILLGYANSNVVTYFSPTWSPTAGTIAFASIHYGIKPDSLLTIDVSVNGKGVPVGSNLKHIYGFPSGTTYGRGGMSWSSTSTMGKLAYVGGPGLCVIPSSGGTPTTVYTKNNGHNLSWPTWNSDDSRLAVVRWDSMPAYGGHVWGRTILIFNTTTWACVDSLTPSSDSEFVNGGLDWSRSGLNILAFPVVNSIAHYAHLDYCTASTGSTAYTNGLSVSGYCCWSPNNSSLIDGYVNKVTAFTTSTTQIFSVSGIVDGIKWKR